MQHNFVTRAGIPNEADPSSRDAGFGNLNRAADDSSPAAHITALVARNRELQAELDRIRVERNRLADLQSRIMELLHVQSSDKLLHDIRNVLNERELLKALVGDI
jgi:hypothetical protein